jgi:hypothetical protein
LHEWCTAAGLGILIYWRPWQDGLVFADSNSAYLIGTILLFGLWAALGLKRGSADIQTTPCALLLGFLAIAWLTGLVSMQYQASQVALAIWCGHVMVFVLAASLRSSTAIGFVMAFVVMTSAAEAVFSIIHLKYSLPETRIYVQNDPAAAAQMFGHELSPALVHRLNSNRAFGTLLFANALATWLIATIPLSLFGAWHAINRFRSGSDFSLAINPMVRGMVIGVVAAVASAPILSAAQSFSAMASIAFPDAVVGVPFSAILVSVPVAAITVVLVQAIAIAVAFGIYALLAVLMSPSRNRGEDATGPAMIAGVLTAGALCIGAVVFYSKFHFFYFATSVMVDDQLKFARADLWDPLVPFLLFVLILPIAGAGAAIAVTRRQGPAAFAWLAMSVTFSLALLCELAALWLTYSRGGMLALVIGVFVALLLLRPKAASGNTIAKVISAASVILFVMAAATLILGGDAHAQNPNGQPPVNPFVGDIEVDGTDMTIRDLVNPTTVSLRFSYWIGAFKMAADHWLTGVGLGNFGLAYPQYQPLGGGDTKQAHNDFLQLFCETGIAGFLLFAGFWGWFIMAGGRRLREAASTDRAWWLAGLYACVLGFLTHAAADFPFEDPSLAMLVFLIAGLFWAAARSDEPVPEKNPVRARVMMSICLVLAVAVTGLSVRTGHVSAAIGTERVRQERIVIASKLVKGIEAPPNAPVQVPDRAVASLIEDSATRAAFGNHFYQPSPNEQTYSPLPPGSPIPNNAILIVTNMPLLVSKSKEASVDWTTRIAEVDAAFPYDPSIAHHLSVWFDMLWRSCDSATEGIDYIKQAVHWAEVAIERSPGQIAYYDWLCQMYWRQALSEPAVEDQLAYYERSLESLDKTIELYPIKPSLFDRHAEVYGWASNKFEERGQADRAAECIEIEQNSQSEAAAIRE